MLKQAIMKSLLHWSVFSQILPSCDQYTYEIRTLVRDDSSRKSSHSETMLTTSFHAVFTVTIGSADEFFVWKSLLQEMTSTQFNIIRTKENHAKSVNFKQHLKCHHNVRDGKVGLRKHTACPARLVVTINSSKSVCNIDLNWNHNHPIVAADVLRCHRVSDKTDAKLIELFRNGHSASSAQDCIRMEVEDSVKEGERLEQLLADRSICPDCQHCQYIFRKLSTELYGSSIIYNIIEHYYIRIFKQQLGDLMMKKRKW